MAALSLSRWMSVWIILGTVLLALPGCAMLPTDVQRTISHARPLSTDSALASIAQAASPDPDLSGFRLMPIAAYALNARIELAKRAQTTLDVQYYHIQNDDTGRYILRMLRDAGLRGVRVRLLLDDLYTAGEDPLLLGLAATPNVEIRLFNPFPAGRSHFLLRFVRSAIDFNRVSRRMHNKLFIADGAMAVAGGRNLADAYFMRNTIENFIDLDTFVTGAVVPRLSSLFDQYWNSDYSYPIAAIASPSDQSNATLQATFEQASGPDTTPEPDKPPPNDMLGYGPIVDELNAGKLGLIWATAEAYADAPDRVIGKKTSYGNVPLEDVESVRYNVIERIRSARQSVVVISPYLIPGQSGLEAIREVRARDVPFTLITNSLAATDESVVHTGYRRYRPELLRMGVDLYELSPARVSRSLRMGIFGPTIGRLHAKSAVIDEKVLFIGSMNFDPRSESLNTELGLFIQSPELAQQVLKLMDTIKRQGAYRLRLSGDDQRIEWTGATNEAPLTEEPDTTIWQRFLLELIAPLVPESML